MGFLVDLALIAAAVCGLLFLIAYPRSTITTGCALACGAVGHESAGVIGTAIGLVVGLLIGGALFGVFWLIGEAYRALTKKPAPPPAPGD